MAVTNDWVSIPVFTGPLTSFERTGAEVTLEAQGKDALALAPHYATKAFSLRKGARLDVSIRSIFRRIGEIHFSVPEFVDPATHRPERLHHHLAVHPTVELWKLLVGGATDASGHKIPSLLSHSKEHRYAFYDGLGVLNIRLRNRPVVFTFQEGLNVLAHPTVTFDALDFRNTVRVTGAKPKGKRAHVTALAALPASHPLSPRALARNGKPRYMTEFVDAPGLKTRAACLRRARKVLKQKSTEGLTASFEALPIPMLEEHDRVRLQTPSYHMEFDLTQFSIPLTSSGTMQIGIRQRIASKRLRRLGALR